MTSSTPDLKQLRELAMAATPGPWQLDRTIIHGIDYGISGVAVSEAHDGVVTLHSHGTRSWTRLVATPAHSHATQSDQDAGKNMAFIAAANPQTLLSLIDRIERLEGALRSIAWTHGGDVTEESLTRFTYEQLIDVVCTDTDIAREALGE